MSEETSFRDRPINMDEDGKRKWIYTKKPNGKWYKYRSLFSYFWLATFIGIPFIKINGNPLIILDIAHRKFIIFGAIFWAQDTFIMALLMLSFVIFILVFTVTFGRVWCGWACPQTIFLEMVFRKIEHLIEGDYKERYKLDQADFNAKKIFKKVLKHSIFIIISFLMTNIFLMWFIGYEKLFELASEPITENLSGFLIMLVVSAFFYWVYSFFREQICTWVCPYGRMQGVLLDSQSIVVNYDYKRGEPRGGKNSEGDCVNCQHCVSVCPTGIDIRNGTQLECINCTACIEACDSTMERIKKPKGLIRFDSIKGIETGKNTVFSTRTKAYSLVLLLIFGFFVYTLLTRPSIETTILRTPGTMFQETDNGQILNLYNIRIINKTHTETPIEIKLESHNAKMEIAGSEIILKDHDSYESTIILYLDKNQLTGKKTDIEFGIYTNGELKETYDVTFVGP